MGAFRDGEEPFRIAAGPDAFWKAPESKWWTATGAGDRGPDDFKDYAMPLVELQRLLDWYPLWVEVKAERADDGQEVRPDLEHQPGRLVSQGGPTSHSAAESPTSPSASAA